MKFDITITVEAADEERAQRIADLAAHILKSDEWRLKEHQPTTITGRHPTPRLALFDYRPHLQNYVFSNLINDAFGGQ